MVRKSFLWHEKYSSYVNAYHAIIHYSRAHIYTYIFVFCSWNSIDRLHHYKTVLYYRRLSFPFFAQILLRSFTPFVMALSFLGALPLSLSVPRSLPLSLFLSPKRLCLSYGCWLLFSSSYINVCLKIFKQMFMMKLPQFRSPERARQFIIDFSAFLCNIRLWSYIFICEWTIGKISRIKCVTKTNGIFHSTYLDFAELSMIVF